MPHPGSRFYLSLCFRSTWGGFSPKIDVLAFLLCLLETTACLSHPGLCQKMLTPEGWVSQLAYQLD